ncbi:MAG: hypothetical protein JW983_08160 [Elusimicrobia bacterium]|nr:hypothetical protein [Elusimicrobiota bacterium]
MKIERNLILSVSLLLLLIGCNAKDSTVYNQKVIDEKKAEINSFDISRRCTPASAGRRTGQAGNPLTEEK